MPCDNLTGCSFIMGKMNGLPGLVELYKQQYCLHDHRRCARRLVLESLGSEQVPPDLYPAQMARAIQLIEKTRGAVRPGRKD